MSDSTGKTGPFTNKIRRGETLLTGWGYITDIREHDNGDRNLLFISIGLQCGWKNSGGEKPDPVYQNIELLVGRSLEKSLAILPRTYSKETGFLYGQFQIRNLVFTASEGTEKIFLNTRGILETVTFGQLDE